MLMQIKFHFKNYVKIFVTKCRLRSILATQIFHWHDFSRNLFIDYQFLGKNHKNMRSHVPRHSSFIEYNWQIKIFLWNSYCVELKSNGEKLCREHLGGTKSRMTSEIRLIFWAFSDVIELLLIGTCPVFSYSNTVQISGPNFTGKWTN